MVKVLASKIGEFMDSTPSSIDFQANFFRVRVRLDVRKPSNVKYLQYNMRGCQIGDRFASR